MSYDIGDVSPFFLFMFPIVNQLIHHHEPGEHAVSMTIFHQHLGYHDQSHYYDYPFIHHQSLQVIVYDAGISDHHVNHHIHHVKQHIRHHIHPSLTITHHQPFVLPSGGSVRNSDSTSKQAQYWNQARCCTLVNDQPWLRVVNDASQRLIMVDA